MKSRGSGAERTNLVDVGILIFHNVSSLEGGDLGISR
jgi:hypothetical protein